MNSNAPQPNPANPYDVAAAHRANQAAITKLENRVYIVSAYGN